MRPLVNEEINDDYTRYLFFSEIDNDAIENARGAFKDYKSRGVIMTGDFEDDEWIMNNELKKFHFHFKLDGRKYSAGAGRWCGISSQKYKICLKTYVVLRLGDIVLSHLKEICKDILEMAYQQMEDIYSARNGVHLNEFINSLPGYSEDRERVIERLEEDLSRRQWKKRDSRKLEGFSSYLKFDAGLTEFWDKADKEQKIMYFPVYFWWKLTVILPLRPTEFILTPVNCIRKADDHCFISVRRTKNKKNSSKKKYTVTDDYEICEYEIPTYLYDDIATYIEMTAAMRSEENRMLLLPSEDAHTWYMTYQQMNYRLHRFIEKELISNDLIINLGDTRHLAMINLMLSGGSPVICRELAGHEDIDISSNYYSNLSTIVESEVYEYCHSGDQAAIFDGNLYFPVRMPENKVRVQEGYCDYLPIGNGDVSECLKNYNGQMRLGECYDCRHFYPDKQGVRLRIKKDRKNAVDMSGEFLMQMIEQVRKGEGQAETIQSAMAGLNKAGIDYAGILYRQYMEEIGNGKK